MNKFLLFGLVVFALLSASLVLAKDPCTNVEKLDKQFRDAGIPIDGVNSKCVVWYKDTASNSQKTTGAQIVANYTDAPTLEQILRQRVGGFMTSVMHLNAATQPANATAGDIYYNENIDDFCFRYSDGTWEGLRKKNGC